MFDRFISTPKEFKALHLILEHLKYCPCRGFIFAFYQSYLINYLEFLH